MLRQFRQRAGLSKSALAKAANISTGYISKLESSQRPPPEAQRNSLAEVLNLSEQERLMFHVRAELQRADPNCLKYLELAGHESDVQSAEPASEYLADHQFEGQYSGRAVPIINKVAAGYPREFTDLDYPTGLADAYVVVPDVTDPNAFAFYVFGDSMQQDYPAGTLLIASPNSPAYDGDACFVRFDPSAKVAGCTFKRVYFNRKGIIRLVAINQKYPEQTYQRDQINGIWPVVRQYREIKRHPTGHSRRDSKASDHAARVIIGRRSAAAG